MSDTVCNLIPGWFTREQWGELQPYVQRLISRPGGVLLLAVTVEPIARNYPEVAFAVFNAAERQALRRALEQCRRRREKSRDVGRSDLAAVSEGKDNEHSL
jgi:hypothetical protein